MKRVLISLAVVFCSFYSPAAGAVKTESRSEHNAKLGYYDFHYDIRYPGYLRSDVGLDKVTEEKGGLKDYTRRVVKWWPKRGMDFTPLEDIPGAPLRKWTPRVPKDSMTGSFPDNFPTKPFKAHLVNFRGVGDQALEDVNDPESYRCPAAVLRFADGSKRVILAKYLCEEDRQYLLKVYLADRARVDKTLLQDDYAVSPYAKVYPEGVEHLYKRGGKVRFDTKHASIVVPSKAPLNGKSWVKKENHEQVMATIAYLKNQMESFWAYNEYAGALVRYWEQPKLYKYYPIFGHGGGGGGGGYSTCSLGGPGIVGVFHEWGHGMACGGLMYPGGGETAADSLQIMGNPANIHKTSSTVSRPWKNLFYGQYPGGGGYEMMADDPNWGYAITAITSTLASQEDKTPMHVYAHLGEERGLWKKGQGIRGIGDMFGQIGARFAEFDCQQEFQFRQFFGSANRSFLMAVDTEKGVYRCPPSEAPEPFGVSISRLIPEAGAKRISVDFQGDFDPETYSDWRTCIVAVDRNGRCRYTPLWNKGKMSMDIEEGDKRFWLTVTATPKALLGCKGRHKAWAVYEAGYTYSYPYQVTLEGCRPGSPYGTLADNHNMALAAPSGGEPALYTTKFYPFNRPYVFDLPPRMDKAEAEAFATQLRKIIAFANAAKVKEKGRIKWAAANAYRAELLLDDLGGAPHPNGGGWVSAKSHADPTAYVGPNCYVLGGAKVLDHARLIDGAIVMGVGAVVRDNAKLSGKAAVIGLVEVSGFARIYWPEVNRAKPETEAADIKEVKITGIPERGRAPGFVANYDCLRPESVLLEDLLKRRITRGAMYGYHSDFGQVIYNGRLVGAPGFDAADDAGAYVFNGRNQYAELSPDVADLGEIMIVMRVKGESMGREQALFDFGGNTDNRFVLELDKGGKPALSWTVGGKTTRLKSASALKAGEWVELRVAIDGASAAIYVDNKEAARVKTAFRAADAFPPQLGRRNLLMRSREGARSQGAGVRGQGARYFAGALDYVRIYSQVPKKGETLPPVPLVSPTKTTPEITAKLEETFGDHPYLKQAYEELARHSGDLDRARTWNDRLLLRKYRHEQGSTPKTIAETIALRDKYYELEAQLEVKRFRLYKDYLNSPEAVQRQKELDELEKERAEAHKELQEASAALRKQYDEAKKNAPKEGGDTAVTPEVKAYQEEKAKHDAQLRKAREDEKKCREKLAEMEKAVKTDLEEELAPIQASIDELRKTVEAREKELSETDGPVAKVFAPVVSEVQATVDRLTKKAKRTPEEEEALRQAKRDLQELIGHKGLKGSRREVLTLHKDRGRHPPTGPLYRDLKLVEMRMKLQHLERSAKARVNDRLMADNAYIAMMILRKRAQENVHLLHRKTPKPPAGQKGYNEAYRELPAFKKHQALQQRLNRSRHSLTQGVEPYANERLGELMLKVETAMNALRTKYDENAKANNPEEFYIANQTSYKRRHFSLFDTVSRPAAARLSSDIEPPDDMKQLKQAVESQRIWYTSIADWDTVHREEKDYENRNHRIKRWMKRVKPYRYGGE